MLKTENEKKFTYQGELQEFPGVMIMTLSSMQIISEINKECNFYYSIDLGDNMSYTSVIEVKLI